jgi:hypothetical protein
MSSFASVPRWQHGFCARAAFDPVFVLLTAYAPLLLAALVLTAEPLVV